MLGAATCVTWLLACGGDCLPVPCPPPGFDAEKCECSPPTGLPRPAAQTPAQPEPKALCDGSHELRLSYSNSGNGLFPTEAEAFVSRYGWHFLVVDGTCRYYARDNPGHPVVAGQLTPKHAAQLSVDVAWNDLPVWGEYRIAETCADAPGATLGTTGHVFICGGVVVAKCGCGPDAPQGLQTAQINAANWIRVLVAAGEPLTGAVAAIAHVETRPDPNVVAAAWPLARSMGSIPNLVRPVAGAGIAPDTYARFEDASETAQLRAIRTSQPEAARNLDAHLTVREGDVIYRLFLRDELPQDDARAIEELTASWVKPEP